MTGTDHVFPVRVQRTATSGVRAYARGQSFDVDAQASLRESDPHPSAIEYALGALGGDLVCGLEHEAVSRGLKLHAIEIALAGRLENVLVHLGVIGEEGHAGLESIGGTLYVGADADPEEIESAWQATLARSPLYNTLSRSVSLDIVLKVLP